MSDFNYYYTFYDKSRGDEVLMALRQSGAETKSEAIDFLIDRGYLHSDEVYDSAVANAMGDFLGISSYNPEEDEEFEAPVGTKHSALDEVHQRLRESGKKRRQQKIAKARRMKQRKFEGHHGHHHAAEMEMTPDIMDYPGLPVVPDSYGTNSALDSGNGVPQWYGSAETNLRGKDSVVTTTSWKPSEGKKNIENRFTPSRAFMDYAKVTKEAPFAGAGSLFKFGGNDSALGGFTAKELTESSAIHGDFDHASLNYSGKQNIEARAESANPTGGATGDQIVSWEHNGLSSPSGPPSDIFWSEGDYGEYVQIFDTTITKKGIEEKLQRAGIKPIEVFSVYEDGTKSKDIFGVYLKEGDATAFSKEFNKNDWTGLFDFEGAVSFSSPSGPPSDIFWAEDDDGKLLCDSCGKLADFNFQDIDVRWDIDDGEFTGNYELRQHLGDYNDFLCLTCAEREGYAAEGYGDVSKYVSIDFTWDYSGEHEEAVSDGDYYITDAIKDLVESEVENGEYSGNGYYSYTVEYENDKGEIIGEDVDIDYSWG